MLGASRVNLPGGRVIAFQNISNFGSTGQAGTEKAAECEEFAASGDGSLGEGALLSTPAIDYTT